MNPSARAAPPRRGIAPGATALAAAAQALDAVVREGGCTAEAALQQVNIDAADRGAVRAIHAGALRWYLRLAPLVDGLLDPGQRMPPAVRAVLTCALHQIEYSRAPAASVVNIAVDAVRVLGRENAAGFVNALLRRYLRERDALIARVDRSEAARLAHPRWLLKALRTAWPVQADSIIEANNETPSMVLRVNLARTTREEMVKRLAEAGIDAQPGIGDASLVLNEARDVQALAGFDAGLVSVQDAGAQRAAVLLDAQPGERVLDACAAPGGKSGHVLERCEGRLDLTVVDIDAARLERVRENLARLGYQARLVAADLMAGDWWDGVPFDRILLDAPCSGTGVIRRHPDIKLLRRPEDIDRFAATQLALLSRCAALLKPGGRLVYATCSVLPAENAAVVERFLRRHPGFTRLGEDLAIPTTPRSRGPAALTDGFYYACLVRGDMAAS
ncbi:MAG: 16S rRNA (cytosine(967)-C(5))-methyltransferase RsmB [Pseudomonadota bacterium]|jgi:16S rRNA (cytosine967-C5)-methyltransferase|nr:MAG: 16S rRNA (cytosine(967)-C(5))-methyltransferase [Pseudomonadota bacterium]